MSIEIIEIQKWLDGGTDFVGAFRGLDGAARLTEKDPCKSL
jgi:hypothetical protein